MTDQQYFEQVLPNLKAIPDNDIRRPDMPVKQAVYEAELMSTAAAEDAGALGAVGFNVAVIEELTTAAAGLRHAEGFLIAQTGEIKEATKLWNEAEPDAYELRSECLAALELALRKIPDAIKAVRKIREGSGKQDLFLDLSASAELAKKYKPHLDALHLNTAIFDIAEVKAAELYRLHTKAFIEKGSSETKVMRDRAFTYMRRQMAEILDFAEYVFRKDRARLEYYHSTYRSRHRPSKPQDAIMITKEEVAPAEA
ncbi:MAG: hypothetical protein JW913_13290 [Chitinispirillaceae bacterium]|nr:hypothetical protein [Chitinispirillaceae bacterium]